MKDLTLLKTLCLANGISGDEDVVRNIILQEIKGIADDIKIDALGNVIVFKRGKNRANTKVMISCHMDEVGFIVKNITEEGYIKFSTVGGVDTKIMLSKRVTIGNNKVKGVIGTKPIHLLEKEEKENKVKLDDLWIDIGATSKEDALNYINIGDSICFESEFILEGGTIKGKALDDRVGCFILIDMIKKDLDYDTYFAFLVQEEIGLHGAMTAAYGIAPEASIVIDATTASDISGVDDKNCVCKLGHGAVISFMDRSTIYDKEYFNKALFLSKVHDIKVQIKQAVAGGNDAGAIHKSRRGVRTLAVSLPCRYIHSPMGMITEEDLTATERIVEKLLTKIAGEK